MTRAKPEPETPAAIWVARAQSGDCITYFTGDLASDRHKYGVARLANEWLRLSDQKLVVLLQKRLGVNAFAYIAVRTAKPLSEAERTRDIVANGSVLVDKLIRSS